MLKNRSEIRSGATAIAVVLAALSTPSFAQDAATDVPAPVVESPAPVTIDSAPTDAPATSEPAASSTAPEPVAPQAATSVKTAAAPPARQRAAVATRAPSRPAASAPAAKASATPPIADPATAPAEAVAAAPIADEAPMAAPAPTAKSDNARNAELGFGGALALLALGGAAAVVRRRRRADEDDEVYSEQAYDAEPYEPAPEPVVAPKADTPAPAVAHLAAGRSAFSWGNSGNSQGTWEERARRGPTPDNPSLSLKKRLKRAAFFDNRERQAALGVPSIDASAGLPQHAVQAARASGHRGTMSCNAELQPA